MTTLQTHIDAIMDKHLVTSIPNQVAAYIDGTNTEPTALGSPAFVDEYLRQSAKPAAVPAPQGGVTILEAIENALQFLEALGYKGGDIVDDLELVQARLACHHPKIGNTLL